MRNGKFFKVVNFNRNCFFFLILKDVKHYVKLYLDLTPHDSQNT